MKTATMTNLRSTPQDKGFCVGPHTPYNKTKIMIMAGVTRAKAWFTTSGVSSSLADEAKGHRKIMVAKIIHCY